MATVSWFFFASPRQRRAGRRGEGQQDEAAFMRVSFSESIPALAPPAAVC